MAFGAQESRRDGDRGDAVRAELLGLGQSEAVDCGLDQVVAEAAAVVGTVAVGDLHDQAAVVFEHERDGLLAGDQVRHHGSVPQSLDLVQVEFPERCVPFGERVPAPHVVDDYVEAGLLGADAGDEGRDVLGSAVVAPDRDAGAAGGGDQVGGVLDGLGAVHVGAGGAGGAAGDVDGGAGGAELGGDATPGAAGCAGHEGDLPGQRCDHRGRLLQWSGRVSSRVARR